MTRAYLSKKKTDKSSKIGSLCNETNCSRQTWENNDEHLLAQNS